MRGLRHFAATEHNGWIHAGATAAVVVTGILCRLTANEWLWIVLAIVLVWLAEALNTAIERLADAVTLEPNDNIRFAKDVAAGAVLMAAIAAVAIGLVIFGPRLLALMA
ncbi:MAG: diacylglycerol kinase family protein [Sphingosinicella sp.]